MVLGSRAMGRLHAEFLQDPSPTDVITFDGDPALGSAGEVCVCADVARDYVAEYGGDFAQELTLYIVHGYLHLAGFDDVRPALKRRMRAAERHALAILERAGVDIGGIAAWRRNTH